MLDRTSNNGILTLRLEHGKASALDLELCQRLRTELESVAGSNDIRAVILTGSGSIFSAGVDLPRMINAGGDYVRRFVEALDAVLRTLFVFPRPVVAALNGHAIAGGAIMAFACDHRLMSGGRLGIPEALVGVPFPPLALEIVRYAVPRQHLQPMIYLARMFEAEAARAAGMIDEVVPADQLLPRATEVASQLGAIAPETFKLTKMQLHQPFVDAARPNTLVDALWEAPATHDRIREYLAKTIRK